MSRDQQSDAAARRDAREWVVQMLFELDLNPKETEALFEHFWAEREPDEDARRFAEQAVADIMANREAIDGAIAKHADHWDLKRMKVIDRNVMRMGVYEILFRKDIPPVVSINEAVDIAKYFSSRESGKFVNGILDKVMRESGRPARSAEEA